MGKQRKKITPDDLKFEAGEIKLKSEEELEMEAKSIASNNINQKKIVVDHSIDIPENVYDNRNTKRNKINLKAFAPYNFVSLNDQIVPSDFDINIIPFDKFHLNKNTGYIKLSILTKTQIYIRDLLTKEESEKVELLDKELENLKNNSEDFKKKYNEKLEIIKNFYSPGDGEFKLSGSTLRGLTRTNVEIMSYGKIGFIDKDRKFHYRAMADLSLDLRKNFSDEILDGDWNTGFYQKIKAGYLIQDGNNYKIKPVKSPNPNCQFFRIEEKTAYPGILSEKMSVIDNGNRDKNKDYKMGFKKIKFTFEPLKKHPYSQPLRFSKVDSIFNWDDKSAPSDSFDGVLIHTGWMPNNNQGKHLHWVIGQADNDKNHTLEFLPGVVEDYKNDEGRVKEANLLDWFKNFDEDEIPCFFLTEKNNGVEKVKSFGHTGIFRLAYERSISDFIPDYHLDEKIIDITEAIFGNETDFSGRVYFEDAKFIESKSEKILMDDEYPQILSNPKPTTFQHYLVQKEIRAQYNEKSSSHNYGKFQGIIGLKDYNSADVSIRGNKMYWHRKNENWTASQSDIDKHLNQLTLVECINKDTTFIGRIRFENLSDIELGALLFALDLPPECCHKIGMGKPLGLGSIKITPTLHLSYRKNRYSKISEEWTSDLEESTEEKENITHFKKAFESHILIELKSVEKNLWKVKRMNELKTMLDFEHIPLLDKTRYMRIEPKPNEFRTRPVLPKPTDVK